MSRYLLLTISALLVFPFSALACSLSVDNKASNMIAIKVNGVCISPAISSSSTKKYDEDLIKNACGNSPYNCHIEMFSSADCSSAVVATFNLDKQFGIHDEMPMDRNYWVGSTGTAYPDSILFIGQVN